MDNTLKFWLIINELIDESKTIGELSRNLGLNSKEIRDMLKVLYDFDLENLWNIEIYDGDKPIESFEGYEDNYENLEVMLVSLNGTDYCVNMNSEERWTLYDMFRECSDEFIKDVKEKVIDCYDDEFKNEYETINKKRLIKQYSDVFNVSGKIIIDLYKYIVQKKCINIKTVKGNTIFDASPARLYFDDNMKSWYLEYVKKKNLNYIRLDNIKEFTASNYKYTFGRGEKHRWGYGKTKTKVKIRIYHEKNAEEIALRFLARKDIVCKSKNEEYSDYIIFVRDINNFRHWLRGMGSYAVVLEPEYLKNEMIDEINKWKDKYQ